MPVERLQCPSCGGMLSLEGSRHTLFCTYCGSRLHIRRGASGNPMGVLDEIKEDTSLLTRERAYAHLQKERDDLLAERERQVEAWKAASEPLVSAAGCQVLGCSAMALAIGILLLVGVSSDPDLGVLAVPGALVVVAAGLIIYMAVWHVNRAKGRKAAKAAAGQKIEEIDARLPDLDGRLATLHTQIDQVVGGM